MVNHYRGEISATFNGKTYQLCLTLGALAELEAAYDGADLLSLAERFETGRIAASDAIKIIGAGLRGGGNDITNVEVAEFANEAGVAGYIRLVVQLLEACFVPASGAAVTPGKSNPVTG